MFKFNLLALGLAASFCGCAAPSYDWRIGKYSVHFQADRHTHEYIQQTGESIEHSRSYYGISRSDEPGHKPQVVESAQNSHLYEKGGIQWLGVAARPSMFIKSFLSESGKTLLISEHIPGDTETGGEINYILIQDGLSPKHLDIPVKAFMQSPFRNDPMIIRVTDENVICRYSDGSIETKPLAKLVKKDNRPNFL